MTLLLVEVQESYRLLYGMFRCEAEMCSGMFIKLMSSAKPAALQPCMFPVTNLEAALEVHVDVRRPTLGSLARAAWYASSST